MEDMPANPIQQLAECLANFGGGAPASVLQGLAAAGNPAEILIRVAQGTEGESVTDSASSVSRMADEEGTVEEPELQYSNNAIMDGLEYLSDQLETIKRCMKENGNSDIHRKLKKLAVDNQEMKTMSRTTSNNMAILRQNLIDSIATHRSDMAQMDRTFTMLHETMQTMLKTMHTLSGVPSVEHRIVVEMVKSNSRFVAKEVGWSSAIGA